MTYVDIVILAHLTTRPQHGYEIKKSVAQTLGSGFAINNNLLYPALRRFEEMGAVRREVERRQGRPDRHVYHLTDQGFALLQNLLREFPPQTARNTSEFLVRVGLFDLLDADARRAILAARQVVLQDTRDHFTQLLTVAEGSAYPTRVIQFFADQAERELEWIDALEREAREESPERAPRCRAER